MKHYNKGIIFGKVTSAKEDKMKGGICANLQISCAGDFGRVNVFAKIWQEEKAKQFLAEENTRKYLRLEGFFAQYKKGDAVKSNYNIYGWDPLVTKGQNDQRAVFILVGDVQNAICGQDGEPMIELVTEREGYTSTFWLHHGEAMVFVVGETYRVKGELRPTEDRFGDTIAVRPLVLDRKLMTEDGPVPVPEATAAGPVAEGDIPF